MSISYPTSESQKRGIVYVVDDDAGMRESLSFVLELAGYHCLSFATPDAFLSAHNPNHVGCCIFDFCLEGLTGIDLLKSFSRLPIAHPVVFLTGYGSIRGAVDAIRLGAVDFLEKPVETATLLLSIERAIAMDWKSKSERLAASHFQCRLDSLSQRERQVVDLISEGLLTKQIASRLQISQKTVEVHRSNINRKMGVPSTYQLVMQLGGLKAS